MIAKNKKKKELLMMMLPYGCLEKCAWTSTIKTVANLSPIIRELVEEGLVREMTIAYREKDRRNKDRYYLSDAARRLTGARDKRISIESILLNPNATYEELLDELLEKGYLYAAGKRKYRSRPAGHEEGAASEKEDPEAAGEKEQPKRRKEGRLVSRTGLCITRRGLAYLAGSPEATDAERELLDSLTDEDLNCSVHGTLASNMRLSNMMRQTVSAFLSAAGVNFFSNKPLRGGKYASAGDDSALCSRVLASASSLNTGDKDFPMLYDMRDVKKICTSADSTDASHYSFVTATHVLVTPGRKFIIYRSKKDGSGLAYKAHRKTVSLVNQLLNFLGEPRGDSTYPVIMLASNITEYRKCIEKGRGSQKLAKGMSADRSGEFGSPANGFYIIPLNWNGAQIVRYMFDHEAVRGADYEKDLLKDTVRKLGLEDVTAYPGRPCVFSSADVLYCIGTDMDIQRIMAFDAYAEKAAGKRRCVLLVEEWQKQYLEPCISHAEVRVVGQNTFLAEKAPG